MSEVRSRNSINGLEASLDLLRSMFEESDIDKDGCLSKEELHTMLKKFRRVSQVGPDWDADQLFPVLDSDNDGKISWADFQRAFQVGAGVTERETDEQSEFDQEEVLELQTEHGAGSGIEQSQSVAELKRELQTYRQERDKLKEQLKILEGQLDSQAFELEEAQSLLKEGNKKDASTQLNRKKMMDLSSQVESLKDSENKLNEQIEVLKKENIKLRTQNDELLQQTKQQLKDSEQKVADLSAQLEEVKSDAALKKKFEDQLLKLQEEKERTEKNLEESLTSSFRAQILALVKEKEGLEKALKETRAINDSLKNRRKEAATPPPSGEVCQSLASELGELEDVHEVIPFEGEDGLDKLSGGGLEESLDPISVDESYGSSVVDNGHTSDNFDFKNVPNSVLLKKIDAFKRKIEMERSARQEVEKENGELQEKVQELTFQLADESQKVEQLKNERDALEKSVTEGMEEMDREKDKMVLIQNQLQNNLLKEQTELKEKYDALRLEKSQLEAQLEEAENRFEEYQEDLSAAQEQNEKLEDELKRLQEEQLQMNSSLKRQAEQLAEKEAHLQQLDRIMKDNEKRICDLDTELELKRIQLEEKSQQQQGTSEGQDIELNKLQQQLIALQKQSTQKDQALEEQHQAHQVLVEQYNQKTDELKAKEEEVKLLREQLETFDQEKGGANREKEKQENLTRQLQEKDDIIKKLKADKDVLLRQRDDALAEQQRASQNLENQKLENERLVKQKTDEVKAKEKEVKRLQEELKRRTEEISQHQGERMDHVQASSNSIEQAVAQVRSEEKQQREKLLQRLEEKEKMIQQLQEEVMELGQAKPLQYARPGSMLPYNKGNERSSWWNASVIVFVPFAIVACLMVTVRIMLALDDHMFLRPS
ncbi:hypothetical protein QOT17_003586 [Balamuthia mandrillaris]